MNCLLTQVGFDAQGLPSCLCGFRARFLVFDLFLFSASESTSSSSEALALRFNLVVFSSLFMDAIVDAGIVAFRCLASLSWLSSLAFPSVFRHDFSSSCPPDSSRLVAPSF